MARIHAICTGSVRVRCGQVEAHGKGLARMANMLRGDWADWLPINCWLIEHEEGLILVDAGESARVHERGYLPRWHPFYRRSVNFSVHPDEEIGPQLRALGVAARDVRQVVLTHLHTDHHGGLVHLTGSRVLVSAAEMKLAEGPAGRLLGYLPHRWPLWFRPEAVNFAPEPFGPFPVSYSLTRRGDVRIVPTPGHSPGHIAVVVSGDPSYFLAGDVTFSQQLLLDGKLGGVVRDDVTALDTQNRILALAQERPLVYLPTHDPESVERLRQQAVLKVQA